jgi:serine/threonine protein phosphatase PrpC
MDNRFTPTECRPRRLPAAAGVDAAFCQCAGDRDEQQDACGVFSHGNGLLAAVADGMGGLANGGAAAAVALEAAGREAEPLLDAGADYRAMKDALLRINDAVYRSVESFGAAGLSGTTLCAAVIKRRTLRLFWCGDSRAYLLRAGGIERLTEDNVYALYLKEMAAEGVISVADARAHPARSRLTGYLGAHAPEDYSISAHSIALQAGDTLLLCTDGLHRCLGATEIVHGMGGSAAASAGRLIRAVVKKRVRGQDNATALVLKIRGGSDEKG